jgi:hypothetical protein
MSKLFFPSETRHADHQPPAIQVLKGVLQDQSADYPTSPYSILFCIDRLTYDPKSFWFVRDIRFHCQLEDEIFMTFVVRRNPKTEKLVCFFEFPQNHLDKFKQAISGVTTAFINSRKDESNYQLIDKINAEEEAWSIASFECIENFNEQNPYEIIKDTIFRKHECLFHGLKCFKIVEADFTIPAKEF